MTTTHTMPRLLVGGAILAIVVAACGGGASTAPTTAPTGTPAASAAMSEAPTADPMAALVTAAKAEGGLTTIALPRSWCNYGAAIDGFTAKYGIPINGLNPDGSSQQELDAISANKGNTGPAAPDVIDVGYLSYGPKAVDEGLIAPYKVADVGRHSRQRQGPGRQLVRRLLRRHGLRDQHFGHHDPGQGLVGPAHPPEEQRRPRRRPDGIQPGRVRGLRQRRLPTAARWTTLSRAWTSSRSSR